MSAITVSVPMSSTTSRAVVFAATALGLFVALPLLGLSTSLFAPGADASWSHLGETGLPVYARTSFALVLLVALGTAVVGVGTAWLTAAYRFPGSRALSWALVLPLAVPSYVIAYAYTDLLQFSGPVQSWIRETWGVRAREYWFPDIRSLGGAAAVFTWVLAPYVYLPVRAAFAEMPANLGEAARLAGVRPLRTFLRVELPLAWPALAAGLALVVMETLADFGAVSYFAVDTLTAGIYKAWLGLGDRAAAAQLALVLLGAVAVLVVVERVARGARRFSARGTTAPRRVRALQGWRAWAVTTLCTLPVALGFLLPVAVLARLAWSDAEVHAWSRFAAMVAASLQVSATAAAITVAIALALVYAERLTRSPWVSGVGRFASFGYAVPGAVLAIGILIPLARFDNAFAAWAQSRFGLEPGLLLTGSVAALVYAYVVRFLAVGLNNVESGFARITPHMDESARSLGCGPWSLLYRVHMPLLARSLAVAALLVFVDALKELPATLALRPFNFDTLATQAYNFAKDERLGEAALPSLIIVAVALVPVLLTTRALASRPTTSS
jgi:iron(III) transport system permease protein